MDTIIFVLIQDQLDKIWYIIHDMISKYESSTLIIRGLELPGELPKNCVGDEQADTKSLFVLSNTIHKLFTFNISTLYVLHSEYRSIDWYRKKRECKGHCFPRLDIENYGDHTIGLCGMNVTIYSKSRVHNRYDNIYRNLLENVLTDGKKKIGRNGYTLSKFGRMIEFDLREGFPLLTCKSVFFRAVFEELMMFIRGQTNTKVLEDKNINIWKPNTSEEFLRSVGLDYKEGEMGPMYGYNWRSYGGDYPLLNGFDQLKKCMDELSSNPTSRRNLMTSFNPAVADKGVLYPCHGTKIQFNVDEENDKKYLECMVDIRSSDLCCGLPFNIASYALFMHMICHIKGSIEPGRLIITLGDYHVYKQHIDNANLLLLRKVHEPAKLTFRRKVEEIEDFNLEDVELEYKNSGPLEFKMVA
jgi:thymidylate synthase